MGRVQRWGGAGALAFVFGMACATVGELGDPCLEDEACASETCHFGICVTGTCEGTTGCDAGWHCVDPPPGSNGPFLDFFFKPKDPVGHCALSCDGCPTGERYACDSDICHFDHEPHVDAGGPYEAIVGEPITLRGSAELVDGRKVAHAEWTWSYDQETALVGLEVTHTFSEPGTLPLTLKVVDDAQQEATAMVELHACVAMGDTCNDDYECCAGAICDAGACVPEPVCGNGVVERGEICDGAVADGEVCSDYEGYRGGGIACAADCRGNDVSGCERCGVTFDNCSSDATCCEGYACNGIGWCSSN